MSSIYIDTSQLTKGAKGILRMSQDLEDVVDDVLNASALEIEETAKQLAPRDRGFLAQHIKADTHLKLKKSVTVNAPYAAEVEFGTGKYAAAYVATLPADWQTFASQFRSAGQNRGTFMEMVRNIAAWIKRKGLTGVYSVKSHRRLGNRTTNMLEDFSLAYVIARSIYLKGIKPQPYLYPAYLSQLGPLVEDLSKALKVDLLEKIKLV